MAVIHCIIPHFLAYEVLKCSISVRIRFNQDTRYKIQELYSQPHARQRKEIGCSRQEHGVTDIQ